MIFKSNTQRQEGLYVTNNIQPYNIIINEKFIVVQDFLFDCLKYNDYKITARIWVVVKCHNNNINIFIYKNGMVYYSAIDNNIASFYDSTKLYDYGYPMTINEIEKKLKINLFEKFLKPLKLFSNILKNELPFYQPNDNNDYYELFGIDLHITSKLECFILEINCVPGMKPHNNIDKKVRNHMLSGYVDIIHGKYNDSFYYI